MRVLNLGLLEMQLSDEDFLRAKPPYLYLIRISSRAIGRIFWSRICDFNPFDIQAGEHISSENLYQW